MYVELSAETYKNIDILHELTGNSKEFYLNEVIKDVIAEYDDYLAMCIADIVQSKSAAH